MANATELTPKVAALEERVTNHIKFFWVVVGFGFIWLAGITGLLVHTNTTVSQVAKAQANAPAQIVAHLLGQPSTSEIEIASSLRAASTVLEGSRIGPTKPDASTLKKVSIKLSEMQQNYPDLPQVWQATGAFINYKSEAFLPPSSKTPAVAKGVNCSATLDYIGMVLSNCEVTLENLAQTTGGNMVNGSPAPFIFINCIVHYSGGKIPAKELTFQDCVFRFLVPTVPPHEGLVAMRQLTIAGDEKQIKLSIG